MDLGIKYSFLLGKNKKSAIQLTLGGSYQYSQYYYIALSVEGTFDSPFLDESREIQLSTPYFLAYNDFGINAAIQYRRDIGERFYLMTRLGMRSFFDSGDLYWEYLGVHFGVKF